MDNLEKEGGRERQLLTKVINFSIHKRWITENEPFQIKTESTANDLERALFQFLKKVKSDETASKLLRAIRFINEVDVPPNSADDEHGFKSMIVSKLFEKSLFTEEEKLGLERKLQLGNKIKDAGIKNCDDPDFCKSKPGAAEGIHFQQYNNPLELSPRDYNIALNKYKRKGQSELALLSDSWDAQLANGFRGPYSCMPHEYIRLVYVGWLILCFLQLVLGVLLSIINTLSRSRINDSDNSYLFFQHTYHETTHLIVNGESVLLMLTAIAGMILCYNGFPSAHIRNVQSSLFVCFICTTATIWFSIALQHTPDDMSYLKNLESEAHHKGDNIQWSNMWKVKDFNDNIWDKMQKDLKCCGYRGYMDWIISPCECIPISCCKNQHSNSECVKLLSVQHKRLILPDDAASISYMAKTLIWTDGCQEKLEDKFMEEKTFWIIFPCVILCTQFIVLTLQAWLAGKILYYITCVPGARVQMDIFRGRLHLLSSYQALMHGIAKLEDPYHIILRDEPFNAKYFDGLNNRNFIIMKSPDEFASLEIVLPADKVLQDRVHGKDSDQTCISHCDSWVQTPAFMWTNAHKEILSIPVTAERFIDPENQPGNDPANHTVRDPLIHRQSDPVKHSAI